MLMPLKGHTPAISALAGTVQSQTQELAEQRIQRWVAGLQAAVPSASPPPAFASSAAHAAATWSKQDEAPRRGR